MINNKQKIDQLLKESRQIKQQEIIFIKSRQPFNSILFSEMYKYFLIKNELEIFFKNWKFKYISKWRIIYDTKL